jgi:hypothetical protein
MGKEAWEGRRWARMMGSGEDKGFKIYSISVQQIDCVFEDILFLLEPKSGFLIPEMKARQNWRSSGID